MEIKNKFKKEDFIILNGLGQQNVYQVLFCVGPSYVTIKRIGTPGGRELASADMYRLATDEEIAAAVAQRLAGETHKTIDIPMS